MVEDDEVVSTIYRSKLVAEGFDFALAPDGEAGVRLAHSFIPDVVILDLGLPKLDGIEVIKQLRADPQMGKVPIIVLTNAYLANRVRDAWAAGATKCVTKSDCTPKVMVQIIRGLGQKPLLLDDEANKPAEPVKTPESVAPVPKIAIPEWIKPVSPLESVIAFPGRDRLLKEVNSTDLFLKQAPAVIAKLRHTILELTRSTHVSTTAFKCGELYQQVRSLGAKAALADLVRLSRICAALEALLKELNDRPELLTASSQRTVAQAIDFLDELVRNDGGENIDMSVEGVLVVDDEPISRLAVVQALDRVGLKCVDLDHPQVALELLTSTQFDLFLLDIEMPELNGFELCKRIRNLPPYRQTPVIFVSALSDFQSRAKSTLAGANDLIAKPFHFLELGVKALVHLWRPHLNKTT